MAQISPLPCRTLEPVWFPIAGLLLSFRIQRNGTTLPGSTFSPAVSVGSYAVTCIAALTEGEKRERYAEYKALRQDMIDYRTLKRNVDRILVLEPEEPEKPAKKKPER